MGFSYDGGGMGKGGKITITANGEKIAEGRSERTIPIQFTLKDYVGRGVKAGSPAERIHLYKNKLPRLPCSRHDGKAMRLAKYAA